MDIDSESASGIFKIIVYLIFIAGAIISSVAQSWGAKKKKTAPPPAAPAPMPIPSAPPRPPQPRQRQAPPPRPRQPAAVSQSNARAKADDSEWLRTVFEREAKGAAKAAAAKTADTPNAEDEISSPTATAGAPWPVSMPLARDGVVWAEILGAPVSMRR
jgi:hypothetical protein